jgi:conjugal transfer/type IV secretion protein DotA/TraY
MLMWQFVLGHFAESPFAIGDASSTLLGSLFVVFNTCIFSVGMIWLTYGIGSSVVGTAHDGEALGKRINTAWYPIRVVVGVSGLVPIFSGFTGSQAVLMWLGTLAIGMANMLWNSAVDNSSSPLMNIGNPVYSAQLEVDQVASDLLRAHVCHRMNLAHFDDMQRHGLVSPFGSPVYAWNNFQGTADTLNYGIDDNKWLCGSFSVTTSPTPRNSGGLLGGFRIESPNYKGIADNVKTTYQNALITLDSAASLEADRWLLQRADAHRNGAPIPLFDPTEFNKAKEDYKVAVHYGVTSATQQKASALTAGAAANMKQFGWMSAGGWYATFAEVNTAVSQAISSVSITSSGPMIKMSMPESTREQLEVFKYSVEKGARNTAQPTAESSGAHPAVAQALNNFGCEEESIVGGGIGAAIGAVGGSKGSGAMAPIGSAIGGAGATATGNCSLGQSLIGKAMAGLARDGSGVTLAGMPFVNPVLMFKNMGDYVMGLGQTLTLIPSSLTSVIPGAGFLSSISWMLLGVGGVMALYVPMIPFIIWMGGLIAYAASFIEGLVAMPLHSLSHLNTDGEGMGHSTAHGYLFWLNTIARPSLMVISFFIGSALVTVLGTLQAALFLPVIANVQGNSITGLASIVGFLLIFLVINMTLINACFELIHVIPDQVIGFIGGGNINTQLGRSTEQKINQMFAGAVSKGSGAAGASPKGPQTPYGQKPGGGNGKSGSGDQSGGKGAPAGV